jgi:hypothetical protein
MFHPTKCQRKLLIKMVKKNFNLFQDAKGFRLTETSHGGCPVLKGSKWILNKWIYYFNQFKKFPCGLSYNKKFESPKGYYK